MTPTPVLWVELLAAAFAQAGRPADPLVVVVHAAHRTMPLLEACATMAYLQLRTPWGGDFRPVTDGFPAPKERLDARAAPGDAAELLGRAACVVLGVPDDARALAACPCRVASGAAWLLHGAASAAGWAPLRRALPCEALPVHEADGWRCVASRSLLEAAGTGPAAGTAGLVALAQRLARQRPGLLACERQVAGARLRLTPDPLRLVVAPTAALAHHVMVENRALFNARGLAVMSLPFEGRGPLQVLLRNVRDRIDGLTVAVGELRVAPTRIDYTERGAVLSLPPTEVAPGRDALMHFALPRAALPDDGFCDIGAVTQTLTLA